jgi:PrtD family type I secretion system ABC transporter
MAQEEINFLESTLHSCRAAFTYVGVFSFFSNLLVLAVPLYMFQLIDHVLVSHSFETLGYLTLLTMVALITLGFLDIIRSRVLIILGRWLDKRLSPVALRRSCDDLLQGHTYANQSLRDVQQIRSFLSSPSIYFIFDAPWSPIFIIVTFLLHPSLGFVCLGGGILLFILAVLNEKITRKVTEEGQLAYIHMQNHVQTTMHNAEVIQAMGMMDGVIEHWKEKNSSLVNLGTISSNRNSLMLGISKFVRLALQVSILGFGAYLVIHEEITVGAMMTATILLTRAYAPIEGAIAAWKPLLAARSAYERLNKYFSEPPKRVTSSVLQIPLGALTAENVGFTPPGREKPILSDVSFTIMPGTLLTIIGPSAAGKTTLARLLVGVWPPTKGVIRLDKADVYTWERKDFGQYIGYMPQEIELFTSSIKDNIARMQNVSDDDIVSASHRAGAHDFIIHLPKGYDTVLIDAGRNLSGGQRQQIALARALLKQPKLLVLDEPTTFLDKNGQQNLFNAITELKKLGTTIVVISHYPALINYSDKILWLDHGKVLLFGDKQAILEKIQKAAETSQKAQA